MQNRKSCKQELETNRLTLKEFLKKWGLVLSTDYMSSVFPVFYTKETVNIDLKNKLRVETSIT